MRVIRDVPRSTKSAGSNAFRVQPPTSPNDLGESRSFQPRPARQERSPRGSHRLRLANDQEFAIP
jgi:hypothetical protein